MGQTHNGTRNGGKLTANCVRRIFILYRSGWSQCELARQFRVSKSSIRNVLRGRTWRVAGERLISLQESWRHRVQNISKSYWSHSHPTIDERFWRLVKKTDKCWWWIGAHHKRYGTFWDGSKYSRATHVVWRLTHGQKLPLGTMLLHSCDNPSCVNPSHLRIGNKADNMNDYISRHGLSAWKK